MGLSGAFSGVRVTVVPVVMVLGLACPTTLKAAGGLTVDVEAAAAWQAMNDAQSPNDASGTRFAVDGLTGSGPFFAPRLELSMPVMPGHEVRLVAAPLRVEGRGTLASPVDFEGESFDDATSARYRFDSYRATWRRTFLESDLWTLKGGLTAKIRDAEIRLQGGGVSASRSDTGFVPLLHFYAERRIDERSRVLFDADGLASSRGRAIDLSLRYLFDVRSGVSAFGGYRILDGGADNDSVYSFARFHYLTFGVRFRMD